MSKTQKHHILLVAGDYERIDCMQRALPPAHFTLYTAFSHNDAVYFLGTRKYKAVIVDADMHDRKSGESTFEMLLEHANDTPIIALALSEEAVALAEPKATSIVTALNQNEIRNTISSALQIRISKTREVNVGSVRYTGDAQQLQEINTLFDLSKSLTEVLDLEEVLSRVVDAARSVTGAEEGMILMPEGEELYLRARTGIKVEPARSFRIKTSDTLAGEVFNSGEPIIIGASGPQKVKTQYFVNSLLYVPIILNNETIGVLGVNNREKKSVFDDHDRQLLENLASFAAIAIDNALAHQESLERSRELETLVAASQVVNSSLELEQTLPNICKQLATVLDVGYSEILDWDRDEQRLNAKARYYQAAWRFGHGPSLTLDENPAIAAALQVDRPVWITVTDSQYTTDIDHLQQQGAAAMLVTPLKASGKLYGVVRIYFLSVPEKPPKSDGILSIRSLALETLVDLLNRTDRIVSDPILDMQDEVSKQLGGDWFELSYWMEKDNKLTILARIGSAVWPKPPHPHLNLTPLSDLINSLQKQNLIIHSIENRAIPESGQVLLDRTQSQSLLGLPLVQRGRTEGLVLFADSERTRAFTSREIDMARAIVGQAAMALDNSLLVHKLSQSLIDLKEAQNRLVQTARLSAMGELAAVVAHQINNPLTTIIVESELLLSDEEEGTIQYEGLSAILRTGKRAANVARRLLTIARPTDLDAPMEPIDVLDSVHGILMLLRTHVERSGVQLIERLPESQVLPKVNAIKGRLDDIWLNLLINAHDAIVQSSKTEGGVIVLELTVDQNEEFICVTVTDNGPGIPESIRQQIFSPFFTTKPVGEGTGLGLHVCRQVIENVGGTISVESEPGQFTRFTIKLPTIKSPT